MLEWPQKQFSQDGWQGASAPCSLLFDQGAAHNWPLQLSSGKVEPLLDSIFVLAVYIIYRFKAGLLKDSSL